MTLHKDIRLETGNNCFDLCIPKGHATDQIPVWYHLPENCSENIPIVIVLHGTSRAARASRNNWQRYADTHSFIVAVPEFERRFFTDQTYAYGNFYAPERPFTPIQWDKTHGEILNLLFDRVRTGLGSKRRGFILYGHSAGAAFAHRYLTLAPQYRVEQAILANAGWYTPLDLERPLPFGIHGAAVAPERVKSLLGMPVTILLGEKDTAGPYADWWPHELLEQGPHRLERGKNYYLTARNLAERLSVPFGWKYEIIREAGHENKKMIAPAVRVIAEHHNLDARENTTIATVSKTDPE
jgi:pimeloyl-ACP methyl ester carboxylesterase